MRRLSKHIEWLSLIEVSGPFLASTVLDKAFPQGLEAVETPRRQRLRAAYEEWTDAVDDRDPQLSELHREWIRLVLTELLEYDDEVLVANDSLAEPLSYAPIEHRGMFSPDFVIKGIGDDKPRFLLSIQDPGTDLDTVQRGDGWPVSLIERMTLLCRSTGVRLGLITNGEVWVLVNAPVDSTSGHATWYARLWFQEPVTLKAFQSLLGVRRCFGPSDETLDALLDESLEHQEEVTDTLGEQVRRAVEVLIQSLDKADEDRNRELLRDVSPEELYEAGLTVMMRLVFVLCAEERGLLLLGDPVYDQHYAVSTLRSQLSEDADRYGSEVLERRYDAWSRLLAVFRAIYAGVEHDALRMPALGGSLFDPDRFSFLEGRARKTTWRDMSAVPLPIDNRTVLLLLNALQVLEQRTGALLLSYKALDVEQIGHVYEGLLEHTVERVNQVIIGLRGTQKAKNPNVSLRELESAALDGNSILIARLCEVTGSGESAIRNALSRSVDDWVFSGILNACGGDVDLAMRIRPYANLLRTDAWGDYIVYRANAFIVTLGSDRRETGTHYTPRSLTESIVSATLEPIAYVGPAEGKPQQEWRLRSSSELLSLRICDPTMGSGAFLVQACRWLSERLTEAWGQEESEGRFITVDGHSVENAGDADPMPKQLDDRLLIARRLIAERCLYGVDMNHMAVQLAKLSIWLVTMAKGRPFGFLDHNLRHGDSLLGIYRLDQLTKMAMDPDGDHHQQRLFGQSIENAVAEAVALRKRLRMTRILDIHDVETMTLLDSRTREVLAGPQLVADALVGDTLRAGSPKELAKALNSLAAYAEEYLTGNDEFGLLITKEREINLSTDLPASKRPREPFHWPLEFPEVFARGGFDAIVGNPPFMGGQRITGNLGTAYRGYLIQHIAHGRKGSADLCAYFFLRSGSLLSKGGQMGLLATNTIAQGDTREVGLEQLETSGFTITRAVSSSKWPGKANLEVSYVWLRNNGWGGSYTLDGRTVAGITSYLTTTGEISGNPYRLKSNEGKSFQGVIVLGMGFIMDCQEAQSLAEKDRRNKDVLFPYLNGEDLTSRPDQSPSRWVINFFDWPLMRDRVGGAWDVADQKLRKRWLIDGIVPMDYPGPVATDYPDCLSIIEARVKSERQANRDRGARRYWWRFLRSRPELYTAIAGLGRVLACPVFSKYLSFSWLPTGIVYMNKMYVFPFEQDKYFTLLNSSIHYVWTLRYSGTLKLDFQYAPTDCFETFPFPLSIQDLDDIGVRYDTYRKMVMLDRDEGLTKVYNRVHDRTEVADDIRDLRRLCADLDYAVSAAYGWQDLDLDHGFHKTKQGERYTISENARQEILQRLLRLNHERYRIEVQQGLHARKR